MITLTDADNGEHIRLKTGEQLRIDLPSNITTGYKWLEKEVPDMRTLRLESCGHQEADCKLAGSPRIRSWLFTATGAGTSRIVLVCAQPWDESTEDERFEVTVEVVE